MSSDVQLQQYPRQSLDDDLTAVDERAAFMPSKNSFEDAESRANVPLSKGDKNLGDEWRMEDDDDDELGVASGVGLGRRLRELYENNTGLLLITLSQFCSSCMNISVKALNGLDPPVPPFELVAIRMAFTYVFSLLYMYHAKVPHPFLGPPGVRKLLVFRGMSGFFGLFGMYYSLQYLSLSDAVVLTFLTPTVTAIVSHFVLKEGFSRGQATAGLCSLFGVILIARPEFLFGSHKHLDVSTASDIIDGVPPTITYSSERGTPAQRLGAVGVSLLGVLGATGAVTSLRAIGKRAHAMHSLTYFSSYSILVSTLGMLVFRVKFIIPIQWQWVGLFVVIGLFGFGTQVTLVLGLQRETASRGMLAMYVQIVFAAILERIFFHVYPSFLSLLGTVVILTCAIYVALSKKAPPSPPKTRVPDIEEVVESMGSTRANSLDDSARGADTIGQRGSADSSVTVLGPEPSFDPKKDESGSLDKLNVVDPQ